MVREISTKLDRWLRQKTSSDVAYVLFGWAQVLAFFLVFVGLSRFLGRFLEDPDLAVMISIPAAIVAVVWIDHLCAYKTGRCFMPYRGGTPRRYRL